MIIKKLELKKDKDKKTYANIRSSGSD